MLQRLEENPLLRPGDISPTRQGLEVLCTLNPAAVRFGEEILLLVRVGEKAPEEPGSVTYLYYDAEDGEAKIGRYAKDDPDLDCSDPRWYLYQGRKVLSSMSHLRLARSRDGKNFTFDPAPAIFPATPYEAYGCEDARITKIDNTYYITYTAVSGRGVTVTLASTRDFVTFERHGIIFPPFQKDVALFPEKVRGMYVCRHRPFMSQLNPACIWTAYSPDLHCWGYHEQTLAPQPGTWQAGRVGAGANPIKTPDGWLEMYHAADAQGRYAIGAMLSDLEHPERILTETREPIFQPEAEYELKGVYQNCVFHNGLVLDDDGVIHFYYGAADRICAGALTTLDEMIAAAKNEL
ncbi:MAG: glycoside hydrolase family 130 protein [Phycisphaerae bacterium]|nr:glycoside hydrolase family 130 protein [Phycisphaerae bacterium]